MKSIRPSLHRTQAAASSFLCRSVLLLFGVSFMPASAAVVVFDNLSAGSPNGYFGVSNTQWTAQAFTTSSAGFIIQEVSLNLWNLGGTTGDFEVRIWDSLGGSGSPGAQVGPTIHIGQAENLGGFGTQYSISGLSVPLVADTTYYLVVAGTGLTDIDFGFDSYPGLLEWEATNVNTLPSYDTVGSGWTGPFSQNLYMRITAVPEPTSMLLSMIAAGALLTRRKR